CGRAGCDEAERSAAGSAASPDERTLAVPRARGSMHYLRLAIPLLLLFAAPLAAQEPPPPPPPDTAAVAADSVAADSVQPAPAPPAGPHLGLKPIPRPCGMLFPPPPGPAAACLRPPFGDWARSWAPAVRLRTE